MTPGKPPFPIVGWLMQHPLQHAAPFLLASLIGLVQLFASIQQGSITDAADVVRQVNLSVHGLQAAVWMRDKSLHVFDKYTETKTT